MASEVVRVGAPPSSSLALLFLRTVMSRRRDRPSVEVDRVLNMIGWCHGIPSESAASLRSQEVFNVAGVVWKGAAFASSSPSGSDWGVIHYRFFCVVSILSE